MCCAVVQKLLATVERVQDAAVKQDEQDTELTLAQDNNDVNVVAAVKVKLIITSLFYLIKES